MHINPEMVSFNGFAILFKILSAHCEFFIIQAIKNTPAVPEDAEELSYKEICTKDQLQEMTRVNNTWNKDYCPSPCEKNGKCPDGAQCIDLSDEKAPNYTCVCRHAHIFQF